jgi:hypothetical protein
VDASAPSVIDGATGGVAHRHEEVPMAGLVDPDPKRTVCSRERQLGGQE